MKITPQKSLQILLIILAVVTILVVARAYVIQKRYSDYKKYQTAIAVNYDRPALSAPKLSPTDPRIGADLPKHTIVVYSSFTCEACKEMSALLQNLLTNNKDKLVIVWKDYFDPSDQLAKKSAIASRCAQVKGKFWEYHNLVYQNQNILDDDKFLSFASTLGLDKNQFLQCLNKQETLPLVNSSVDEAVSLRLDGVPTLFVDNKKITEQLSVASLEAMLK